MLPPLREDVQFAKLESKFSYGSSEYENAVKLHMKHMRKKMFKINKQTKGLK